MSPNVLDFYCVTCKEKVVTDDYRIKISDSGRRMAQGMCPRCKKTKVNKILGKDMAYVSPNHPVFSKNLTTDSQNLTTSGEKPNSPQYRVKISPDGKHSHWWELEKYSEVSGLYNRVKSGYANTRWGGRFAIKRYLKGVERRSKQVYLDVNYKPL